MKEKILKNIIEILAILIICLISFVGIYVQKSNQMENIVKSYELTKELKGYRQIVLEVSDATEVLSSKNKIIGNTDDYNDSEISNNDYVKTENKVNSDESLTTENYKMTKNILEKRLKDFDVEDYSISVDYNNGNITILLPEDSNTDTVISNILQIGKFAIKDSESGEEFIKNEDIKKVSTVYNTTDSGTTVYLQIELNKNGKEILYNLSSGEYASKEKDEEETDSNTNAENEVEANVETQEAEIVDENSTSTEENNNETTESDTESTTESDSETTENEEENQKEITLTIDTNEVVTTSFSEPMTDGIIDLSIGQASQDTETINENVKAVSRIATILNNETLPLTYKIANNMYIHENIQSNYVLYIIIGVSVVVIALMIYLIIKYKIKGLWAALSYLGYAAIYLLLIRYTNVSVSISSIIAILISLLINFELNRELLNKEDNKTFISFIIKLVPIYVIALIFSFIKWTTINTLGMTMFWGISLSLIYNWFITKNIIKIKQS